jgi:hypothetical protein
MVSKLKTNKYKLNFIKKILRNETFFIFQTNNMPAASYKSLNNLFVRENLKFCKINTTLCQKLMRYSPLKSFLNLLEGPIILCYFQRPTQNYMLKNILRISDNLIFLGLKNGKKLHSVKETENRLLNTPNKVSKLNYILAMKKNSQKLCVTLDKISGFGGSK